MSENPTRTSIHTNRLLFEDRAFHLRKELDEVFTVLKLLQQECLHPVCEDKSSGLLMTDLRVCVDCGKDTF